MTDIEPTDQDIIDHIQDTYAVGVDVWLVANTDPGHPDWFLKLNVER